MPAPPDAETRPAAEDVRSRASILIPVFNQVFYTRVCLTSLAVEQDGAEVIVVDNGSTDATPQLLREWESEAGSRRVLRFEENRGFGPACNAGAELAGREVLVFLNNDTFVLEGWLARLLEPFSDPSITVTGSRLLYPSGHVQHAGVAFNELGPWHVFVGQPGDAPLVLERREYQVVTGASLAIRAREFRRLGGFDTSYQNSFEDVDLCLRVRESGGRVLYVPESVAYHFEAMTEGRTGPTDKRSYELFMSRWKGRFECDVEGIQRAAEAAGYDLSQRVPSRREVMDREQRLAERDAELQELRRMAALRSVRLALAARGGWRRLFRRRR
jgi:GT2 family glycosyltransferase